MKNYIVLILCICFSLSFAQNDRKSRTVQIADKYFLVEDYYLATDYYRKELESNINNAYAVFQLGECHRLFFDYKMAKRWYARCMELDAKKYPLAAYYYALMLKIDGEYLEAEHVLEDFENSYEPEDSEDHYKELAHLHYEGSALALDELQKPVRDFEFHGLDTVLNTSFSEFAPAIYENDSSLVFASSRITKDNDEIYGRSGEGFLDIFWFQKSDTAWFHQAKREIEENFTIVNSKFNDGAGVFNTQKDKYYFTRCDVKNKEKTDFQCGIYVTSFLDGSWNDPLRLNKNINPDNVWNAQPALSPENDTLFFVSKREGGYGQHDIWYSVRENNDANTEAWGEAKNMGDKINTPYIDLSPSYYAKEHILFFSSNGHKGFGGLDIFIAKGKKYDNVYNLGLPFNSNKDDFYFVLGKKIGYSSSNREGQGNDDIFQFNIESKEALIALIASKELQKQGAKTVTIRGTVLDDKKNPKEGVTVMLTDSDRKEISRTTTSVDGQFVFADLDPSKNYRVTVLDENPSLTSQMLYRVGELEIIGNNKQYVTKDIPADKRIAVKGRILDEDGKPRAGVIVALLNDGVEIKKTTTDKNGLFVFADLDPNGKYTTVVKDKKGHIKDDKHAQVNNVLVSTVDKKDVNTTSLDVAAKGDVASRVTFESIYFDFNQSKLRPEAKKVLDELVEYLQSSSIKLKIEIDGHTDAIGSSSYNIKLGKKRGNIAYDYLIKKGIEPSMIVVNSIGEGKPVASNKTPEGRQLNRRVEFFIIGGGAYSPKAMIYILNPKTSIGQVVKDFNMTEDELKELNNLKSTDALQAYRPLRVRKNGMSNAPLMVAGEDQKDPSPLPSSTGKIMFDDAYNKGIAYNKYDGSGYYMVLPRNTLFSIAKICQIEMNDLKKINNLTTNSIIYPGQVLKVNHHVTETKENYQKRTSLADVGVNVSKQEGEIFSIGNILHYVVKEGDTFYSICKYFNVGFEQVKILNNLASFDLSSRMVLKIKEQ